MGYVDAPFEGSLEDALSLIHLKGAAVYGQSYSFQTVSRERKVLIPLFLRGISCP